MKYFSQVANSGGGPACYEKKNKTLLFSLIKLFSCDRIDWIKKEKCAPGISPPLIL